jgi:GrpB-like predicted nucleotidyltransferase (UPF0157 family)
LALYFPPYFAFRNYLRKYPEALQEYAEIKKQAALKANHDGNLYRKLKQSMFQNTANDH